MNEGHFVYVTGQIGEDLGDPFPTFAVLSKFERRLHQRSDGPGEESREAIKAFQFFAVEAFQSRLVIPRVDVAGAAINKEPDDSLCSPREMRLSGRKRIRRIFSFTKEK